MSEAKLLNYPEREDNDTLLREVRRIAEALEGQHEAQKSTRTGKPRVSQKQVNQMLAQSPIGNLLRDENITDILINGHDEVYVGHGPELERVNVTFRNNDELEHLAEAIAHSVGRAINEQRPLVDARLSDGSRVNIIAPPMAVNGLAMSIRKFPKQGITLDAMVSEGMLSLPMAELLKACAAQRVSLLVSGGTGTGKTTLLNAISAFIPNNERIITIEDTAELRLQQPHVVRLETKEPSMPDNRNEEVSAADLVKNALRMRPHRIIVGEVRGAEVFDMLQAMNTGHEGSMTTLHANNPREAVMRLENLLEPVMQNTNIASVRRQIVTAIGMIVQIAFTPANKRVVSSITELVGMEGETATMQEIFTLKEGSEAPQWTGIVPHAAKLSQIKDSKEWAALLGGQVTNPTPQLAVPAAPKPVVASKPLPDVSAAPPIGAAAILDAFLKQ